MIQLTGQAVERLCQGTFVPDNPAWHPPRPRSLPSWTDRFLRGGGGNPAFVNRDGRRPICDRPVPRGRGDGDGRPDPPSLKKMEITDIFPFCTTEGIRIGPTVTMTAASAVGDSGDDESVSYPLCLTEKCR